MKSFILIFLTIVAFKAEHRTINSIHPWNTPPKSSVNFTVAGVDNVPDLFGDINNPQLVVFFGGNQFRVIDKFDSCF